MCYKFQGKWYCYIERQDEAMDPEPRGDTLPPYYHLIQDVNFKTTTTEKLTSLS